MNRPRSAAHVQSVAVFGGAGFIGSALVRQLVAEGYSVAIVDNFFSGVRENLSAVHGLASVTEMDALQYDWVRDYIGSTAPDFVVNCIGDAFIPTAYDLPERFLDLNIKVALNLLRASAALGVCRFLHLSSTEVYGDNASEACTELASLAPENTYAVSKLAADRLCHTYGIEHGLQTIVARLFNAYGPRETHPYIVPEIVSQLAAGDGLILGDLDAERDFTYVDDTAAALSALLRVPAEPAEVFNIGSGGPVSVRELAHMTAAAMSVEIAAIGFDPRRVRRRELTRLCCDSTKLRARTGWRPKVDMEHGLALTVDWFRANGSSWSWQTQSPDAADLVGSLRR